jgi:hypothetical protein
MADRRARGGGPPGWFVVLCIGIWSAITLLFDGITGSTIVREQRAWDYPTVPAVVTASNLKKFDGKEGPLYSARIGFRYTVAGREYTSDRWSYGRWSTSDSAPARAVMARYPVGAHTTARYRPSNPADAVLEAGLAGQDGFMVLFLGPFNAVMLAGWLYGLGRLRVGPCAPTPLAGARVSEAAGLIRVRLHGLFPPVFWGLAAYGAVSFVEMFIAGFAFRRRAPLGAIACTAGIAGLLGLVAWAISKRRLVSGRRDLLIDPVREVLTLPRRLGGGEIPFADILGVNVANASTSGNKNSTALVALVTRGGKTELFQSWTRAGADRFAEWLRARLALE